MPTKPRTEPKPRKIIETIVHDRLQVPTLETRPSDRLDFHEVAVWEVRAALEAHLPGRARSRPLPCFLQRRKRSRARPR